MLNRYIWAFCLCGECCFVQPAAGDKKAAPPKKVSRTVDLLVNTLSNATTPAGLNQLVENESNMAAADKLENERLNARVFTSLI